MTTIHAMTFLLWVYFPLLLLDVVNRGLELSEERKLNTFITDYIDSCFIIYKSARYVPFVQCRRLCRGRSVLCLWTSS